VPWFKVDDQLATHPKIARAGLTAMGLWVKAGSWSAQHGTNGHIPTQVVALLGGNRGYANRLVKAGLWVEDMDGWRFRDWFDYQPSAAYVEAHRQERSETGRRGNHLRWHTYKGITDPDCPFCRDGEGAE
jgi:hypothetical protein